MITRSRIHTIAFAKEGHAAFLSHLDTMRALDRSIRRSGLPVSYSRGCNPHLRLSSFQALPVGLESEREHLVLRFEEEIEPAQIQAALECKVPEGFKILEVLLGKVPPDLEPSPSLALEFSAGAEAVLAALKRLFDSREVLVEGKRKGKPYRADVRSSFLDHRVEGSRALLRLERVPGEPLRLGDVVRGLQAWAEAEGIGLERIIKLGPAPALDTGAGAGSFKSL